LIEEAKTSNAYKFGFWRYNILKLRDLNAFAKTFSLFIGFILPFSEAN